MSTATLEQPNTGLQAASFVVIGEFAIDQATGEIVGLVDDGGNLIPEIEARRRFQVNDHRSLEWAIGKLFRFRVEQAALATRIANLQKQAKVIANQEKYFMDFVGADMAFQVSKEVNGGKKRSIATEWGTVGFRATQGSIKVVDQAQAVVWAKDNCPEAIKVLETIVVTPLKGMEDGLPEDLFAVEPAGDKFYYSDGLAKPSKDAPFDLAGAQW